MNKVLPLDRFVGAEATPHVPILQPMASFLLVERGQSKGLWLHMCPRQEYHLQHAHVTNSHSFNIAFSNSLNVFNLASHFFKYNGSPTHISI